jgi:hypothetical protein
MTEELKEQLAESILKWTKDGTIKWKDDGSWGIPYSAHYKTEYEKLCIKLDIYNQHSIREKLEFKLRVFGWDCCYAEECIQNNIVTELCKLVMSGEVDRENMIRKEHKETLLNRVKKLIGK